MIHSTNNFVQSISEQGSSGAGTTTSQRDPSVITGLCPPPGYLHPLPDAKDEVWQRLREVIPALLPAMGERDASVTQEKA